MGYGVLLFLLFLVSETMGTVAGFGSSAFFISLGQFVFGFKTTLVLTSLQHVFGNITKMVLFYNSLDWKLILMIGIPSLIMTFFGAVASQYVSSAYSNVFLGFFLMVTSAFFLKFEDLRVPVTAFNTYVGGGLAGLFAGIIGTGGPIRGILLSSFNLEKNLYVGTSAFIDFGVDVSRTIVYLRLGYLSAEYYSVIWLLFAIALAGTVMGKYVLDGISQKGFRRISLTCLFALGVVLIVKELNAFL